MIKSISYNVVFLLSIFTLCTACNSIHSTRPDVQNIDTSETLYIYEDGRMQYKTRFVNKDDVVIYNDGRGGEKAAIKVRVPIHSDFYRDSIVVVRVINQFEEAITQNEKEEIDSLN